MNIIHFSLAIFILIFFALAPHAQAETSRENNIQSTAQKLMKKLDDTQKMHFLTIYQNAGLISTAKAVEMKISKTAKACIAAHPDIADALNSQSATLKESLTPLISEAEANLNNMVVAQDYLDAKSFETLLTQIDQDRQNQTAEAVITQETCTHLGNTLPETQNNLENLLRSTLVSFPKYAQ